MSRGVVTRLLLVIALLAGCAAIAMNVSPRLGLDLRGGTQIVLETSDSDVAEANAENTDKAVEVLRGRVDSLGVAEPTLVRQGENRILVELPDLQDPEEAIEVLGRTAQLTGHRVLASVAPEALPSAEGNLILRSDQGDWIEVAPTFLRGDDITGARAQQPETSTAWVVAIDFTANGGRLWQQETADAACVPQGDPNRRIAFVLDDDVVSSPAPESSVGCGVGIGGRSTQITGNFTFEEAEHLAVLIEGGALPLPVEVIQVSTVGPTLGERAIKASVEAAIIGLILTGLFIIMVYRLVGFLATLALCTYALIAYAVLLAMGATLTLPGLAGFVLAIGMAIDANVLIFERAREEYDAYPSGGLKRSLSVGFNKAFSAIIDSNITTLLAAGLLFLLAAGPVKGFGVTLSIGVIASMISALVVSRVLTEVAMSSKTITRRPAITGLGSIGPVRSWLNRKSPDLMRHSKKFLAASAVMVILALAGIGIKGLNLGVEFTGGRVMEYQPAVAMDVDDAREAVAAAGFPDAVVQTASDDKIAVRTSRISAEEERRIHDALIEVSGVDVIKEVDEQLSASLGTELRNKALLAFIIALLAQMLYMAIRFIWTFGLSAMLAMFHDVIIVVGIFAWLGKPIDGVFLAAALTIIGLSVNDSVVVFDRIREKWRGTTTEHFPDITNKAIVDTLPRTINTGMGAMFILAALAILGGDSLQDFAIALLLGLTFGSYSSLFTAAPLAILLQRRWPLSREEKVKKVRDPQDSGAVV
ncbi:protein translocase subunit SecD [Nocardioides limicola]|uniref:protein translocase subunit SecD n=1 Tax=Nocardioides limicola TaxID=2803368 RepID=UPI00193B8C9B|nr:protein translocase subunit SecD [Nocardioides sp. DJM-14]